MDIHGGTDLVESNEKKTQSKLIYGSSISIIAKDPMKIAMPDQ